MRNAALALLLLAAVSTTAAETPSRRDTIASILRLSRIEELEKTAISAAVDALLAEATTAEQKEALQQLRVRALSRETEQTWAAAYDRAFDDRTLAEALAFYRSPAAQYLVALTASTLNETLPQRLKRSESPAERDLLLAKKTVFDLRTLAVAIEAHATDTNDYPETADMETLRKIVEPIYIRKMPSRDAWGHELLYVGTPDRQHYRIVSAGADGVFAAQSRRFGEMQPRESDRYDDDIIFQDGQFLQAPHGLLREQ